MIFWLFMLIMTLAAPLTMLILGRRFMRSPPQEISAAFGYRTNRSCQNRDTWEFAHRFCGRLWYRWGLILLPLSVLVMLLFFDRDMAVISTAGAALCGVQFLPLAGAIIPTEAALKRAFDEDGNRRFSVPPADF